MFSATQIGSSRAESSSVGTATASATAAGSLCACIWASDAKPASLHAARWKAGRSGAASDASYAAATAARVMIGYE